MTNQLVALIVDESKWLTVSMGFALIAARIRRRTGMTECRCP